MQWSVDGPIAGMNCVNVTESADEHAAAWSDNFLCLPPDAPYDMRWSSAGPIAGWTCVRWYEGADLDGTWGDNYLCVVERPSAGDGGTVDAGASSPTPIDAGIAEPVDASSSELDDGSIVAFDGSVDAAIADDVDGSGCSCAVPGRTSREPSRALHALAALLALALARRRVRRTVPSGRTLRSASRLSR
jgi:MYXO-CTERM domain-containing protein